MKEKNCGTGLDRTGLEWLRQQQMFLLPWHEIDIYHFTYLLTYLRAHAHVCIYIQWQDKLKPQDAMDGRTLISFHFQFQQDQKW